MANSLMSRKYACLNQINKLSRVKGGKEPHYDYFKAI